jgi:hypothetical protein
MSAFLLGLVSYSADFMTEQEMKLSEAVAKWRFPVRADQQRGALSKFAFQVQGRCGYSISMRIGRLPPGETFVSW